MSSQHGTAFSTGVKAVYVHGGPPGKQGDKGQPGDEGPPGDSITTRGAWQSGATYAPLDAVTYRSTALDGVDSLYIQLSSSPEAVSTVPPHLDAARWDEIGAVSFGNAFGGIWEVYQADHGFEYVGTPAAFDMSSGSYIAADAEALAQIGICVVREVVDKDRFLLQSTGEVPYIDARVIWPTGSEWEPGSIYYVSDVRGKLQLQPSETMGSWCNPILVATDAPAPGARNGVALPWSPAAEEPTPVRALVGFSKFYYDAVGGERSLSGPDRNNYTLSYVPDEESNEVFVNGLNLDAGEWQMADGESVELATPLQLGDYVEIWAAAQPVTYVVPSTIQKLDDISIGFNGSTTEFSPTVGTQPITTANETNLQILLDGWQQEPGVDFFLVPSEEDPAYVSIQFAEPPDAATRFFGWVYEPYRQEGEVNSFVGLNDTPLAYTSQAGKVVRVNSGESALRFGDVHLTELPDMPSEYIGAAGKILQVTDEEDGMVFVTHNLEGVTDVPAYAGNNGLFLQLHPDTALPLWAAPTFAGLADTPEPLVADKLLVVNGAGDGVAMIDHTLLNLKDAPNSYEGRAGQLLAVNDPENALTFSERTLVNLTDTPPEYTGAAGKALVVNSGADGIEFGDPASLDGYYTKEEVDGITDPIANGVSNNGQDITGLVATTDSHATAITAIGDQTNTNTTDIAARLVFSADWQAGTYPANVVVLHDNTTWVSTTETTDEPGPASSDWTAIGGGGSVTYGPIFPADPLDGAQHYLTVAPVGNYIFMDDGDSEQWVSVDQAALSESLATLQTQYDELSARVAALEA